MSNEVDLINAKGRLVGAPFSNSDLSGAKDVLSVTVKAICVYFLDFFHKKYYWRNEHV
jgi:hypothetical protein